MDVTLGQRTVAVEWRRSRRRRTVAISIHPEHGVVVHTPDRYPSADVVDLVRRKGRWILKHLDSIEASRARQPRVTWEPGGEVPYRGRRLALRFGLDGGRQDIEPLDGELVVGLPLDERPEPFADWVRDRVTGWLWSRAREEIEGRVAHFQERVGARPAGVRIKQQRRRWGSCSAKGRLNFNRLLILAPPPVLDYVVVHELCHLRRLDHSPEFWGLVEQALPGHQAQRDWLRAHGSTLTL